MPRTWGYIVIVIAAVIGIGALLLPIPETVEVAKVKAPAVSAPRRPAPQQSPAGRRPKPAQKSVAKPPASKRFPMQDTTKTRRLVDPKKKS